jgi:hypothetical protein
MTDEKKEIQVIQQNNTTTSLIVPQYSIEQMISHRKAIVQLMKSKVLIEKVDYGKIPGCGDKEVLYKAGAEKIGYFFGLAPVFNIQKIPLPNEHMEYQIICTLTHRTACLDIAQGVGSCSTMETKWRFRKRGRKCPSCNKEDTIIKGKVEYGGGWVCYKAKGGCNAKFKDGDSSIEDQELGRIEHDNPADYYNTCLKMGKKRAFVDAILIGTAASDLFTQDVEEMQQNDVSPQNYSAPKKTAARQKKDTSTEGLNEAVQRDLERLESAQSLSELTTAYDKAFAKVKALKDGTGMTALANKKNERKSFLENVPDDDVPF